MGKRRVSALPIVVLPLFVIFVSRLHTHTRPFSERVEAWVDDVELLLSSSSSLMR